MSASFASAVETPPPPAAIPPPRLHRPVTRLAAQAFPWCRTREKRYAVGVTTFDDRAGSDETTGTEGVPADLRARLESDRFARELGVEYLEVRRGFCRAALRLGPAMVNYLGTPHGAVIFALADAAFGVACNSHGEPAVAQSVTITYVVAAPAGARLIAECRERTHGRRTGVYDATVTSEDGTVVAVAHCVSQRLSRRG
jgi:acyl-CoA thioesterase